MADQRISVSLEADSSKLAAGFAKAQSHVRAFETSASKSGTILANTFGRLGPMLAGGAILTGMKSLVGEFARMQDLAARFDVDVVALQKLGAVAELSGTSLETVAKGMQKANLSAADAAKGNKEAAAAFAALRINAVEFAKLDQVDQFSRLAKAIAETADRNSALANAQKILGRSAGELMPMLAAGSAEIQRMTASIAALSAQEMRVMEDLDDKLAAISRRIKVEGGKIVAGMGEGLIGFVGGMQAMIDGKPFMEGFKASVAHLDAQTKINQQQREITRGMQAQLDAEKAATDEAQKRAAAKEKEAEAQRKATDEAIRQVMANRDAVIDRELSPSAALEVRSADFLMAASGDLGVKLNNLADARREIARAAAVEADPVRLARISSHAVRLLELERERARIENQRANAAAKNAPWIVQPWRDPKGLARQGADLKLMDGGLRGAAESSLRRMARRAAADRDKPEAVSDRLARQAEAERIAKGRQRRLGPERDQAADATLQKFDALIQKNEELRKLWEKIVAQ